MNTRKGRCITPGCTKIGQEFITHPLKFICPECKAPLAESVKDNEDPKKMPWKAVIFVIVFSFLILIGILAYDRYLAYQKEKMEQREKTTLDNNLRSDPEKEKLQQELEKIISSSTTEVERENLIFELTNKYRKNIQIIHIDTTFEPTKTKEDFEKYLQYLKVFSQEQASLRIIALQIEDMQKNNDSLVINIKEKIIQRDAQ